MAALAFDPQLPLARPAPRTATRLAAPSCDRAQLQRLLAELAAGAVVEPDRVLAVEADALLDTADSVAALARSGCAELVVAFDTLGPAASPRAARLAGLVDALHAHRIRIHARFTIGYDHDEPSCFETLVEWIEAQRIASVELGLWTPAPGSSLIRALAHADRVRHTHFGHWDGAHVVISPAQMSEQTLYRGWVWAQLRLASLRSQWRRRPAGGARAVAAHLLRALARLAPGCATLRP